MKGTVLYHPPDMSLSSQQRIRFGLFEVDARSGELRRKGSKVDLQDQPFQALVLLLERPGEVVTREELSKRLWPENTFVDFDRGLNKAINKLRVALRDNAEKPCYIETLPQRGYRFIARVENLVQVADRFRPQQSPQIDSLAVLPLDNLSSDPAQEYFSDGMTEELICAVARIASLRVISRTSVMIYKSSRKSLPAIAKELSVDAIVEGTVLRSGQRVRITVQLILAPEDRHLWSGRYERDLRDILKLQAEVAQSIANQIHKLVDPDHAYPEQARQVHPQAYEACLKGNFFRDKMTPIDLGKSVELFAQAIDLDPEYARAFGDLSRSYFYLGLFGMGDAREMFPKAEASAQRALELDETVASAHQALAVAHVFRDWDWAAAEAEAKRAVELNPGESVTHAHFADFVSIRGRHSEAIAAFSRVLELDPISRVYIGHFGLILYRARRYDESIAQCQRALEIDPQYTNALWFLALSLEQKGELPASIAKLEKAVSLSHGPHYRALLGRAYALAGERTKAINILDELQALFRQRYVSPFDIAVAHVGLGDETSTFQWLEDACQQRVFRIIELLFPMFDSLRADPRWQDLVRRIGLPQ
ncbi:MAG: winged helix-turn-helix domain-containing tetratricopeptide repeat protein [Acidobacteriaceae bacterium]